MIAQVFEKSTVSGGFTVEQIEEAIAQHKFVATSQFTAQEIAIKHLQWHSRPHTQLRGRNGASRRYQRSHTYGDCHWAGK